MTLALIPFPPSLLFLCQVYFEFVENKIQSWKQLQQNAKMQTHLKNDQKIRARAFGSDHICEEYDTSLVF